MSSYEFVKLLLVISATLVVAGVAAIVARALYHSHEAVTSARRLAAARKALVLAVSDPQQAELSHLHALPFRLRVRALIDVARGVSGTHLLRVRAIAAETGVVTAAERMVRGRRWWQRLYGARVLTMLGPDSTHTDALFHDRHPLVRAQAAEWSTTRQNLQHFDGLISLVYDDAAICRFSATDALLRIGTPAVPAIVRHLDAMTGPEAIPLLDVAAGIGAAAFLRSAVRFAYAPHADVRARAAAVLGSIGGDDAVRTLLHLLQDDHAAVVVAAAGAFAHLEHWKAASQIARLLYRPEPRVRAAAANALRELGAPGELLLRRAAARNDSAAAIARQALDVTMRDGAA